MVILTLNCGSSSVKFQLYEWEKKIILARGGVERVVIGGSFIRHFAKGRDEYRIEHDCPTHTEAIDLIINTILDPDVGVISDITEIKAVGHRVVHGGERFAKSVIIDPTALDAFREVVDLSPLHNPANIMGIEAAQELLPDVPHCAVMDTAWHQTMPRQAYLYALPYEWYTDMGVRRYGFHGTSFLYIAKRLGVLLGKDPFKVNAIIAHIGNGSSINAVKNGISIDTSMGLTPLEGLVMGTRCGDIDPSINYYIMRKTGMSPDEIETVLNRKSGVLGVSGKYADRRDITDAAETGDDRAEMAIELESYRLRKYIGSYTAVLGRVDALAFTAGVGEMNAIIRGRVLEDLRGVGIIADLEKNALSMTRNTETEVTGKGSKVRIFVIPTDEELVMTEDTFALMDGSYDIHTDFVYSFQKREYVNKDRQEDLKRDMKRLPGLEKIIARIP